MYGRVHGYAHFTKSNNITNVKFFSNRNSLFRELTDIYLPVGASDNIGIWGRHFR